MARTLVPTILVFAAVAQAQIFPVTLTVQSTPNPAAFGQTVTFSAVINPSNATGAVAFYDGGEMVGAARLADGQAQWKTATLRAGVRTLRAVYSGDNTHPKVSASLIQRVNASAALPLAPPSVLQAAPVAGAVAKP